MKIASTLLPLLLLNLLVLATGCIESPPAVRRQPFAAQELDACLVILVDMSGSFAYRWQEQGYGLCLDLMDQFFTEGMGSETRVVIGQLSGAEQVVLFEGTPGELRQQFQTPTALSDYLQAHSDGGSSPVYEATGRAVRYVSTIPGITDQTQLMTVVLSDLVDSEGDKQLRQKSGSGLLTALKQYQAIGGGIGFYYVAEAETGRWQRILQTAGFESGSYVIQSGVVARPQLPRFD